MKNQLSKTILLSLLLFIYQIGFTYTPKVGDLYFQDLNCGKLCNAITDVTYGIDNTQISHVAMLIEAGKTPYVIEAIGENVHLTSLQAFLNRSVDSSGKPRVIVMRLKPPYNKLIAKATTQAKKWLNKPYNSDFNPNNHFNEFYCSQLIYDAFLIANNNKPIFKENTMTFKHNGQTLPAWVNYFNSINKPIPEGKKGTNPGMMSRSDKLEVVYQYGSLRSIQH
ncbi:MAG: hypothetical protein EP298_06770 [Gammaproteobacteria bacterium]|nr:MAG: hypothetical protein EP298_06770 [Gammaproteobacteria bacterium]UTW42630.1 hypothetical protein KFE69_00325 [bacterium SCSIO 12844]